MTSLCRAQPSNCFCTDEMWTLVNQKKKGKSGESKREAVNGECWHLCNGFHRVQRRSKRFTAMLTFLQEQLWVQGLRKVTQKHSII